MRRLIGVVGMALSVAASAAPVMAQTATQTATQTPSQIHVSARGEVRVTPDRAQLQLSVETRGKTAALAAAENNRKQTAVLGAIKALGVPAGQITTLNYQVSPNQRYDEKERRTVIDGYVVSNTVQVITDKLDQTGLIIDAALSNGANRVAGLEFSVKDLTGPQDAALTQAVQIAKRQAEVAAKAAGGTLGELLELIVSSENDRPTPRMAMAMAMSVASDAPPPPISEGSTAVGVSVSTRWRFVSAR